MSHNKFGRRLARHRSKPRDYFEGLAASVVRDGHATVEFGSERFEVILQKKFFRRYWLSITTADGRPMSRSNVSNYRDRVGVIADYLMFIAADIPGVIVPPT